MWLADFQHKHSGAYPYIGSDDGYTLATFSRLKHWRQKLLKLTGCDGPAESPSLLAIHSSVQWYFDALFLQSTENLSQPHGSIKTAHLLLSGAAQRVHWSSLVSVEHSVTIRGCMHMFQRRCFSFLSDINLTGQTPVLNLVGGRDMVPESVRACLINVAFLQCSRRLLRKKPFAVVKFHMPIPPHQKAAIHQAWDDLPGDCKGYAQIQVLTQSSQEYLGPQQEEALFCLRGANEHSAATAPCREQAACSSPSPLRCKEAEDALVGPRITVKRPSHDDSEITETSSYSYASLDQDTAAASVAASQAPCSLVPYQSNRRKPYGCACGNEVWSMDGDWNWEFAPSGWIQERGIECSWARRTHEWFNHRRIRVAVNDAFGYHEDYHIDRLPDSDLRTAEDLEDDGL